MAAPHHNDMGTYSCLSTPQPLLLWESEHGCYLTTRLLQAEVLCRSLLHALQTGARGRQQPIGNWASVRLTPHSCLCASPPLSRIRVSPAFACLLVSCHIYAPDLKSSTTLGALEENKFFMCSFSQDQGHVLSVMHLSEIWRAVFFL